MTADGWVCVDGNEAAARVAHRLSEVIAIYPITPASTMGELADTWSAAGRPNLWGQVPEVVELQIEAGAAGVLHGAVLKGALATTFTASQGLLLMLPNMFKIAGELTPTVIHVAARTVATHALSIFGDHSDVMAARPTGWAMLAAGSVQEAHDLALVAHAATLASRVPFLHFFDGFRTSHEVAKIQALGDDDLRALVDDADVAAHRDRGLSPDRPQLRGSAQNPDVFFQAREAINPFYAAVPGIVQAKLDDPGRPHRPPLRPGRLRRRRRRRAGAGADGLGRGGGRRGGGGAVRRRGAGRAGHGAAVPAVPGRGPGRRPARHRAAGGGAGPDQGAGRGRRAAVPGRGLCPGRAGRGRRAARCRWWWAAATAWPPRSSPRPWPRRSWTRWPPSGPATTSRSGSPTTSPTPACPWTPGSPPRTPTGCGRCSTGSGRDGTVGANKTSVKIVGEGTDRFAQGYFVLDSKKSGSVTVSHLRIASRPIRSTYLIGPGQATFVACHQFHFLDRMDVLGRAAPGATFLLNSPWPADQVWDHLPVEVQREIIDKGLDLWVVDAARVARDAGMGHRINTVMQPCFFALSGVLPRDQAIAAIKAWVEKAFSRRGEEVVARNFAAVDGALDGAAAGRGAGRRRPPPATAARPCPSRRPTSSSGSPPGCWRATATCCRSAPCPSTAPSRPGRPGGRSGRWPPRSPSGTRRSASTAASAPSSARTRPSAPRCSAPRPWRAPRTGSRPRISAPGTCPG